MMRAIIFFITLGLHFAVVAQTDSLTHYLEIAARNNPDIMAMFSSYRAALQKIPQAGALTDPQLEIGFFLKPMEIVDGRQAAEVKLMQMFPWFGVRKAARTEALHMAQMSFEQFRERRDRLFLDIYTQWFTLCRLRRQLINTQENRLLLIRLEELALKRFAAPDESFVSGNNTRNSVTPSTVAAPGSGSMSGMAASGNASPAVMPMNTQGGEMGAMNRSDGMSGVLRIQIEIAEAENGIESLEMQIEAEKAMFNSLLNRPLDTEIVISDSLSQIPFLLNKDSVLADIKRQNPMLAMLNEEEAAYVARAEMERRMSYPMFGIGLQYMLINKRVEPESTMRMSAEESSMNGKDMLMPMVAITIPIFRNKYKAQQRETAFLKQSNREKYKAAVNMLEAELYSIQSELKNAAGKISLYRKQSELSQSACSLAISEFASGKGDLSNVIQVQRQLLDYNLKTSEAIATYNIMVARVQKLISTSELLIN